MEIQKINCASCGAPLEIPNDVDLLQCQFCHAQLSVKRGEGYVTLKIAEKLSQAVEQSGNATQSVIRDSTQVTQSELKRLQIGQDLAMLQLQLTNLQSEIRSLERGKRDNVVIEQINDLYREEKNLKQRIQVLENALMPSSPEHQRNERLFQNVIPQERKKISGWVPIIMGGPLIICGILFFLTFVVSQIGNEAGMTDNLTGFFIVLFLCPTPLLIFGVMLMIIGFIMLRKSEYSDTKEKP
jgi:hypothetical protein